MDIYSMYLDQFLFDTNKAFDFCFKTPFTMAGWIVILRG